MRRITSQKFAGIWPMLAVIGKSWEREAMMPPRSELYLRLAKLC